MVAGVLFPLQACKIFSEDPKDTYVYLDRIIKNSLLFFEEVWFEGGAHDASYGESHNYSFKVPYNGLGDYARRKASYSSVGQEKKVSRLTIKPEGRPNAKWTQVAASPARSYYVSFEGALEELLKNFSGKELDFIRFLYVSDASKASSAVHDLANQIKSRFTSFILRPRLEKVCRKWDIGTISSDLILREAVDAIFLSRACGSPPVLDGLHKDVVQSIDSLKREIEGESRQVNALSKVMELAIPDYGALQIEKILELRREPSIEAFRRVITHISSGLAELSEEEINIRVAQEINKELIEDIKSIAPKSEKNVILSAAADCIFSTPVPPPYNAILLLLGLAKTVSTTISDVNKIERWKKSFGCFWMKLVG